MRHRYGVTDAAGVMALLRPDGRSGRLWRDYCRFPQHQPLGI